MANRYWVGGAGYWGDTAHWSTANGGAGGASVPTGSDDVYFTSSSGTGDVTLTLTEEDYPYWVTGKFSTIGWNGSLIDEPGWGELRITGDVTLGSNTYFSIYPYLSANNKTISISSQGATFSQYGVNVSGTGVVVYSTYFGGSPHWDGYAGGTIRLDADIEANGSRPTLSASGSGTGGLQVNLNGHTLKTGQLTRDTSSPSGDVTFNIENSVLDIVDYDVDTGNRQALNLHGIMIQDTNKTGTIKFSNTTSWGPQTLKIVDKALNIGTLLIEHTGNGNRTNIISGNITVRNFICISSGTGTKIVQTNSGATINATNFIATGPSSANKLNLGTGSDITWVHISSLGSSYGQNVDIKGFSGNGSPDVPHYIGSNSTNTYSAGSQPWVFENPPKIATFSDPLTSTPGSNTNWITTGAVTNVTSGLGAGGYSLGNTSSGSVRLASANTYDLIDSWFAFEILQTNFTHKYEQPQIYIGEQPSSYVYPYDASPKISQLRGGYYNDEAAINYWGLILNDGSPVQYDGLGKEYYIDYGVQNGLEHNDTQSSTQVKVMQIRINSNGTVDARMFDGTSFYSAPTNITTLTPLQVLGFRSSRIVFAGSSGATTIIGSINVLKVLANGGAFLPFFIP